MKTVYGRVETQIEMGVIMMKGAKHWLLTRIFGSFCIVKQNSEVFEIRLQRYKK